MKKINKMTDLPKWFSLDNYNSINGLSDLDLINQLAMRMEVANDDFEWLDTYPGARNEFASFMEERFSNPIRPLSGKLFAEKIKRKKCRRWDRHRLADARVQECASLKENLQKKIRMQVHRSVPNCVSGRYRSNLHRSMRLILTGQNF